MAARFTNKVCVFNGGRPRSAALQLLHRGSIIHFETFKAKPTLSVRPSRPTLDMTNALSLILEWARGCAELPVATILAVLFGLRD